MKLPAIVCGLATIVSPVSFPVALPVAAQTVDERRPLEHEDYDLWNTLQGEQISHNGQWVSYLIVPGDGDATLKIREIASDREYSVIRGQAAKFSDDSRFVAYTIAPDPEVIRQMKADKKDETEFPQPALEILDLETGNHTTLPRVSEFAMPEKAGGWIAFRMIPRPETETVQAQKYTPGETWLITPEGLRRETALERERKKREQEPETPKSETGPETTGHAGTSSEPAPLTSGSGGTRHQPPAAGSGAAGSQTEDAAETKKKDKQPGTTLVLRNLNSGVEQRFPHVVHYQFNKTGVRLAFTTSAPEPEGDGVHWVDLKKAEHRQVLQGLGNYGVPVLSDDGRQLAFLTDRDDYEADKPAWSLYWWKGSQAQAKRIVDGQTSGIPEGWWVSPDYVPVFSEDGRWLYFGTAPQPEKMELEEEDPMADPVAKLDVWHWQDPFLQPQQLLQVEQERKRNYRAVCNLATGRMVQLGTRDIPDVEIDRRNPSGVVVGLAPDKYNKMRSWDIQAFVDSWLIDLKTGAARLVLDKSRGRASLSPGGRFITWWDGENQSWFALPTRDPGSQAPPAPVNLGRAIGHPLQNELHDTPSLPAPYGVAGWLAGDQRVLIYDRWDIWSVDPAGQAEPVCLTGGEGRRQQIRFRHVGLDPDQRTIDLDQPILLGALVHQTKASGYYWLRPGATKTDPHQLEKLLMLDERVGGLRKARDTDAVILTRSTFRRCPDLWATTLAFKSMRRISHINPRQDQYRWGTAELVHWQAGDGQPLDGLLYKPDGFDPARKYPLLVYFYERNSDNLHAYYPPAAGRSIINFSFYVSRGYLLFVPDISYKTGEPGPSAANAILPGVKHLVRQGFVDEAQIGTQGHSWGGYQIAWLVTQTDLFACAESGAPVSNMTSAYGGIRWGTGMSRMFQYEKTQSRIGDTLWNARDRYIANSPLFFADRITTPLLILHNDQDTAVPWYQGIELFVALRRLEKPAWMLNYNGDPHWVMSDANRKDFARRMQQFFDHYLKGDPMPVWMAEGIPAVDKGETFGFEYLEPEKPAVSETK